MKKYLITVLLLMLVGCSSDPVKDSANMSIAVNRPTEKELQDDWYHAYTKETNAETERMYDCVAEIWDRAGDGKKPSNGGPACREACSMIFAINAKVDTAPAYIADSQSFRLDEDPKVCPAKRKAKP